MGTYDTRGGAPLHDPAADNEPPIGPLEEQVLGALEQHDIHYAAWSESRTELASLFVRVLSAWVHDGVVLNIRDRKVKPPRCLMLVNVAGGHGRGAASFRIVGKPSVEVAASGDPTVSYWTCSARPISPATGKEMSGRPGNSVRQDDTVTLRGHLFVTGGDEDAQTERDNFTRMVAEAERILCGAEARDEAGAQEAGAAYFAQKDRDIAAAGMKASDGGRSSG